MNEDQTGIFDNRLVEAWGKVVEATERHDRQAIERAQAEVERVRAQGSRQVRPVEAEAA